MQASSLQSRKDSFLTDLNNWANNEGLQDISLALYLSLGLDSLKNSRANISIIAEEVRRALSDSTLNEWNANLIVSQLQRFADRFFRWEGSQYYLSEFQFVGDKDAAKKLGTNLTEDHYLLSLLVTSLPAENKEDPNISSRRRMLRLWLLIHELERIIFQGYHGDKKISAAARYLILDSLDITEWRLIDRFLAHSVILLGKESGSVESTNYAFTKAAEGIREERKDSPRDAFNRFLGNIISIADNKKDPFDKPQTQQIKLNKLFSSISKSTIASIPLLATEDEGTEYEFAESEAFENDLESSLENEDSDSVLIVDVDHKKTEAAQLIESNAVFLQSAEQAQCLPWSWDGLLPAEVIQFEDWVSQLLACGQDKYKVAGALCWFALQTGRSLELVLRFPISESCQPEWSLDPDFKKIKRSVLRRQNSWIPKNNEHFEFISPFDEVVLLDVIPAVSKVIFDVAADISFEPQSLTDIWESVSNENITSWFTQSLPDDLERLTSGKLFNFLQQKIYNATSDHNLARSYSAHPRAGLPAACGYSSWDIAAIEKGIQTSINTHQPKSTLLIGSRLNPLESYLRSKIQQAYQALSSTTDLIEHHNHLAQYVCAALYASTGCRYLQDPFESLNYFDLEIGIVFINDKSDDNVHQGRIVPLASGAIDILKIYLIHLEKLARATEQSSPDFSSAIKLLINPNATAAALLPLFFLIDNDGHWQSMSTAENLEVDVFGWELPANLFRHRFAQQLSAQGVSAEVIDGWMGHLERNAAPYSDTSIRCRKDDIKNHTSALNHIFDSLAFEVPEAGTPKNYNQLPAPQLQDKLFGEALRKKNREKAIENATESALHDIDLFLGGKSINEINEDEISKICKLMLYKDGQIAHHFAALRLNLFREKLEASDNEFKNSIRKRVLESERQKSLIKSTIPHAINIYEKLSQWAKNLTWTKSRGSKIEAAIVGTLLLAIEKRISYPRLLNDVFNGNNFRFVQHKKNTYFEYSEELDKHDHFYQPVQRHQISYQTASALEFSKTRKQGELNSRLFENPLLKGLQDILGLSDKSTFDELLKAVIDVIEQANLFDLPGVVASALSGRILSTSLPMDDWLRAFTNRPVLAPSEPNKEEDELDLSSFLSGKIVTQDTELLRQNTRQFKQELAQLISGYQATPTQARAFASQVEKLCESNEGNVSTSILLVGFWIASIASKGKGHGKALKPFALSTIQTYFSSLFTAFEQLAYDVDLTTFDNDDLTDLWQKMIDYKRIKQNDEEYFSQRLLDFNRFAVQHGVEMADWAELQINELTRTVRAGFITESDYQQALSRILKSYDDHYQSQAIAFVLFLGYRFGLRFKEAIGLLRKDLCSYQDNTWILVRNNRFRKLKTHNSRRAVPLLFELSDIEKSLLEAIKTQSEASAGTDKNAPLLAEVVNGKLQIISFVSLISPAIIKALREVTGSQNLVFHHARHSFFNNCAIGLLDIDAEVIGKQRQHINSENIKCTVLGQQYHNGRRSTSALAKLMGHHTPHTSLKNYSHLILEWADTLTPVESSRTHKLDSALNTSDLKKHRSSTVRAINLNYKPITLNLTIQLLRLVSLGKSFEDAGIQLQIKPEYIRQISDLFFQANRKMYFIERGKQDGLSGEDHPYLILRYLNNDAWLRLLECSNEYDDDELSLEFKLDNIENLVSSHRRQLLLNDDEHVRLLSLFIVIFKLDSDCYSICATNDDTALLELVKNQGLPNKPIERASSKGKKLIYDAFNIYKNGELESVIKKYIVFDLYRNDTQILRNSLEAAVAFLALASLSFRNS